MRTRSIRPRQYLLQLDACTSTHPPCGKSNSSCSAVYLQWTLNRTSSHNIACSDEHLSTAASAARRSIDPRHACIHHENLADPQDGLVPGLTNLHEASCAAVGWNTHLSKKHYQRTPNITLSFF